jgi:(1->4)-alpha-D-glucan 1-alpha-D-glucosylmutase
MNATDQTQSLLARAAELISRRRHLPEATYRLQMNAAFTFRDAATLTDYLADLGITHCYASPYLQARPGSTHGYDIINHHLLNPEIGTEEDYAAWVEALHGRGIGQILDTVPNHMGIMTDENPWWRDVLENGPGSPYAKFFDISWHASPRPELQDKVLVPTLGDPYGKVLESGQLKLQYEAGAFTITYFQHRFPVAPRTYSLILRPRLGELEKALGPEALPFLEYQSILTAVEHLPPRSEKDPVKVVEGQREKEVVKRRLATLTQEAEPVRAFLENNVRLFNGTAGDRHSFDLLDHLLDEQAYRLAYWRVAADEINYRRFFDINDLAALSMERPEVFEATHELILRLLREGKVNGLRIDHVDGLYDPKQYLEHLQERYVVEMARAAFEGDKGRNGLDWNDLEGPLLEQIRAARRQADSPLARPLYVVVEKILGTTEPLPESWPIFGTSGYSFLNEINALFIDGSGGREFTRLYQAWTGDDTPFADVVYQKKYLILQIALSSELQMLAYQLDRLAQKDRFSRDFTLNTLRHALREIIACFPVYRSYISAEGISDTDRRYVEIAVRRAMLKNPAISRSVFRFVQAMLLQQYSDTATQEDKAEQLRFAGKFQQVTSPVMAKGLEDTAFYVYNRLVSLNEVGGDPDRFGVAPEAMHRYLQHRAEHWPWALSPLATHDTKRGEDVRARLNVLSELPRDWEERLRRWGELNEPLRHDIDDVRAPDRNEEYLIYQILVGAWPLPPTDPAEHAAFVQRVQVYVVKALHEAKVHSSWINPDADYDQAVQDFVGAILDEGRSPVFLPDLQAFTRRINHYGLFNSLGQTLLRLTAPGVPDTYQGTELWDFSLVDPDNRRPVDYGRRRELLGELQSRREAAGRERTGLTRELTLAKEDGRIKLYVTREVLHLRREHAGLFSAGEYVPVQPAGGGQDHVFSFLRRQGDTLALVAVPRLLTRLVPSVDVLPLGKEVWGHTALLLPDLDPAVRFENVFTGEPLTLTEWGGKLALPVADLFAHFPVALAMAHG